jgi:histidinol-phosphate/aromatic aminotransferase/cobyric acid decarboxylase-like protein
MLPFHINMILHPNGSNHFQVLVVNGGAAAMEVLACCLLDPGDVLLTPSPCYTRIFVNFSERFTVSVVDVLLRDTNEVSSNIQDGAHKFPVDYPGYVMITFFIVRQANALKRLIIMLFKNSLFTA